MFTGYSPGTVGLPTVCKTEPRGPQPETRDNRTALCLNVGAEHQYVAAQFVEVKLKKLFSCNTPFRCLNIMPPEGITRAGILPGCPNLDRGSRKAERVGFEPRTFWSVDSRSNHLSYLDLHFSLVWASSPCPGAIIPGGIAALLASLAVGLWLSIGAIVYPTPVSSLPLSTANCSMNVTTPAKVAAATRTVYSISYLYYTPICLFVAFVFGLVFSAIFRFNSKSPVPSQLLAWQARVFYRRLSIPFAPQWRDQKVVSTDSQVSIELQ
ncbi:hypothetical protein CSKR_108753 [Clonorchis sinensis]|uniref:Uncharacterized protein n=1 Tax=Clonorchis sinensis TaxID=79923 RepID=A0A8T1M1B2_CLOSI|nr:hypothetical protein CSKR_108753 [Clonorchis sinensis]